jgi:hypothetical protein
MRWTVSGFLLSTLVLVGCAGPEEPNDGLAGTEKTASPALIDPSGGEGFSSCTASQTATLKADRATALLLATRAYNNLAFATSADVQASAWRSRWFGAFDQTRLSTVVSHFAKIRTYLSSQALNFFCQPSCSNQSMRAYVVNSESQFNMHLCPAYFTDATAGFGSRAGFILHEASHQPINGATADFKEVSTADCEALARTNPAQAAMNAASHQLYAENTLGAGFTIESDTNHGKYFRIQLSNPGKVTNLDQVILAGTTCSDESCYWTYHNGMIMSAMDPAYAINAAGGARFGAILKVNSQCTRSNPDCTWTYRRGMFVSDRDPSLAINAWGGANNTSTLALHNACTSSNTDCTWTQPLVMFTGDVVNELAFNAMSGAREGAQLGLHVACTGANRDCGFTYQNGMIKSAADNTLALNAWGGARAGAPILFTRQCTSTNPDCTWSYVKGMLVSDRDPSLVIMPNNLATWSPMTLFTGCTPDLDSCVRSIENKR